MKDSSGFKYFLNDHLGSVSLVLDSNGGILEQQRYLPFGQPRTMAPYASVTSTDFTYTGQRDLAGLGLMDYKARFYSPYLNHFTQPDSIVPDPYNSQAWDRYAYALNNPMRYIDPSGHFTCQNNSTTFVGDCEEVIEAYLTLLETKGGKEGQALVDAFRKADTISRCGRGGCIELTDQISITDEEDLGSAVAQYQTTILGDDDYVVTANMMNGTGEQQLVSVGSFGHEIVHQTQGWFRMETVLSELEAWDTQDKLYENMGLASSSDSNVNAANEIASYKYESEEVIMNSNWAKYNYGNLPFTNIFTPKWHPSIYPLLINQPR